MNRLERKDRQRGTATAELGVMLPLIMLGLVGLADFGRAAMETITIANAAHAGAKYGAHSPQYMMNTTGIHAAVLAELQEMENTDSVVVGIDQYCNCPDGTEVSCDDGVCGLDASTRRTYVAVRVEKLFSTVINYPGVPDVITIAREAHVRAR